MPSPHEWPGGKGEGGGEGRGGWMGGRMDTARSGKACFLLLSRPISLACTYCSDMGCPSNTRAGVKILKKKNSSQSNLMQPNFDPPSLIAGFFFCVLL